MTFVGGGGIDDQRRPQLYYQPQFQQWQHPQMQPQQPQLHATQQQLPDSSPVLASGMPNPESQFYPQQFLMYNPAMQPAMAAMPQQVYVAVRCWLLSASADLRSLASTNGSSRKYG